MQIGKLDHVNIRTTALDAITLWYVEVLGLQTGPRPNFPFPGVWLYASGTVVIHLVGIEGAPATGSEASLKLEHFAFSATGVAAFEEQLQALGVRYRRVDLTSINLIQLNVWDPDGNHMHIDFPADELPAIENSQL